jgi:putative membrane protein
MMYWYTGSSGWGYALMILSMVVFWGLVIAGIVALARWSGSDRQTPPPQSRPVEDPRQVLAERYARGEIDETDYRQRLKVLSGT